LCHRWIAALLLVSGWATSCSADADRIAMPRRGICAHRGAGATHPENTLPAFREAIRLGAHQIELDVRLLKDGVLAVIHDPTVDRTTNGHGRVVDFTAEAVKRLDAGAWKHPRFTGTRVPTLAEALEIMPRNVWVNVHLKDDSPRLGEAVAREIIRQRRTHQAFLACGHAAADAAGKVSPDVLICNMERHNENDAYVLDTVQRRCRFIQFFHKLGTPLQIDQLKRAGVSINYYGTNDAKELARLFASGVDFPLVDRVADMLRAARSLGIEPLTPSSPEPASAEAAGK
jgi:glycerophosphoryl diester phosphodiesterase